MGQLRKGPKSKMAAGGHLKNYFFYGLGYSVDQHMVSGDIRFKEFIFGIFLMIRTPFDQESQDGLLVCDNACVHGQFMSSSLS